MSYVSREIHRRHVVAPIFLQLSVISVTLPWRIEARMWRFSIDTCVCVRARVCVDSYGSVTCSLHLHALRHCVGRQLIRFRRRLLRFAIAAAAASPSTWVGWPGPHPSRSVLI